MINNSPPWWATSTIGIVSALLGIAITAALTRGREHQRWLWEKRAELYVRIINAAQATTVTRALATEENVVLSMDPDQVVSELDSLDEAGVELSLFAESHIEREWNRLVACTLGISRTMFHLQSTDQEAHLKWGPRLVGYMMEGNYASETLAKEVTRSVQKPPTLLLSRRRSQGPPT